MPTPLDSHAVLQRSRSCLKTASERGPSAEEPWRRTAPRRAGAQHTNQRSHTHCECKLLARPQSFCAPPVRMSRWQTSTKPVLPAISGRRKAALPNFREAGVPNRWARCLPWLQQLDLQQGIAPGRELVWIRTVSWRPGAARPEVPCPGRLVAHLQLPHVPNAPDTTC